MRLRLLLCLIALAQTLGGPWIAVQGAAWARMLAQNSQQFRFKTAVQRTFDGKHPCEVCRKISEVRREEQKKPVQDAPQEKSQERSPELWAQIDFSMAVIQVPQRLATFSDEKTPLEVFSAPPIPPPRQSFATSGVAS